MKSANVFDPARDRIARCGAAAFEQRFVKMEASAGGAAGVVDTDQDCAKDNQECTQRT